MRLWTNRRKPRDDEKPGHGSDRRGSYRIPSAPLAWNPPGGSKHANLANRHTGRPSSRRGFIASVLPDLHRPPDHRRAMRGRATARAEIACEDAFFAHTAIIGAIDFGQWHADRRKEDIWPAFCSPAGWRNHIF